ncbi:MAG TPA: xanthine dehydrogenase family protein subunit M [Candidatus Binatia bacterium]|nr:xanthine dehydrogenase family protein subunit M [Candidatus Binatia bacterium]
MIPAAFDYIAPRTLEEAVRALADHGEEAKLLAGGHSLLPLMKLRLAHPKVLVDISKLSGLSGIRQEGETISIGALATHYQVGSSVLLGKKCPLLPRTAQVIGDVQVRNRGTIGGSLVHADPAADWPAAILALRGKLKLSGPNGDRWLAAEEFFLAPMTTAIEPTEILTEIRLPVSSQRCGSAYQKMAQQASGFALVGVAVWLRLSRSRILEEIGVGVTGLGEKPFRAQVVEERLRGNKLSPKLIEEAAFQVAEGHDPMEDLHASAKFRAHLAQIYTSRAIREALKRN